MKLSISLAVSLILYILENIFSNKSQFNLDKVIVVTGYKAELVENIVKNYNNQIKFIRQDRQLGTANAVMAVKQEFKSDYEGSLAILCGDAPLINIVQIIDFIENK